MSLKTSLYIALLTAFQLVAGQQQPNLELRALFVRESSELKVSWINKGPATFLVSLGYIAGTSNLMPNTTIYISGSGFPNGNLVNAAGPAGIAGGRIEPFVVCLPPGTEFTIKFATAKLMLPRFNRTMADIQAQPWHLFISFVGRPAFRFGLHGRLVPYDTIAEYGVAFPFWTGAIKTEISNPLMRTP